MERSSNLFSSIVADVVVSIFYSDTREVNQQRNTDKRVKLVFNQDRYLFEIKYNKGKKVYLVLEYDFKGYTLCPELGEDHERYRNLLNMLGHGIQNLEMEGASLDIAGIRRWIQRGKPSVVVSVKLPFGLPITYLSVGNGEMERYEVDDCFDKDGFYRVIIDGVDQVTFEYPMYWKVHAHKLEYLDKAILEALEKSNITCRMKKWLLETMERNNSNLNVNIVSKPCKEKCVF